jgi:hypothetical protein
MSDLPTKHSRSFKIRQMEQNEVLINKKYKINKQNLINIIPGDQEGLFKLAVQLRKFFNSVIYNTATIALPLWWCGKE